jgi:spore germination protein
VAKQLKADSRRFNKRSLLGVVLLLPILTAGCVERRVFEQLGLIVAVGSDYAGEDRTKLKGTSVLYQLDPDAKDIVTVIANEALTIKGIRQRQNTEASRSIVAGQLRVIIYEDRLASDGIYRMVDTLSRDPSLGTAVYLAVSSGKSADILQYRFPEVGNVGTYLYQMIKQNIAAGQIPSSTLHEFLRHFYSKGSDPILPVLERVKDEIHISRLALFLGDRMVGTLSLDESLILGLLKKKEKSGNFEMEIPQQKLQSFMVEKGGGKIKDVYVSFDNLKSTPSITLTDAAEPAFQIKVDAKVTLQEISVEIQEIDGDFIKAMETAAEEHIKSDLEKLLSKLKKLKVDPVGFGEIYSSSVRGSRISKEEWRTKWAEAKTSIDVHVQIKRTGVMK